MLQIDKTRDSCRLAHEALEAPVLVRKNARARRMTLRVSHTRRDVILTIPSYANWSQASKFLEKHIGWVRDQIETLPEALPFRDGALLPLEGEAHELRFLGPRTGALKGRKTIEAVADDDGGPRLRVIGERQHAPRRLRDWLKKRARERLTQRVRVHEKRLGLKHSKLSVRDQSSRWGSCSSTGGLSFSWRLIFAPKDVLDYVAAHEVAHLAEMNHSQRFWKLVAKTRPDYEQARQWLRRHGHELHRYGVEE